MDNKIPLCFLLFGAVILCYYNSLECGFAFDDMSAIRDNKDLRPNSPLVNLFYNDFWGSPMSQERSHKSYRPLCVLTFRINYLFGGLNPMGYHLVNVLMHGIVCIQMFLFGLDVSLSPLMSFLASLLFAVHPVHTEAVTGVVGRAELLSSIFYFLALMFYRKSSNISRSIYWIPLCCSVVLVTMATLSKEQGITVVGVCCVYEFLIIQKLSPRQAFDAATKLICFRFKKLPEWLCTALVRASFLVLASLLLLFLRIKVMGAQLPVFTKFDNPGATSEFPQRFLTHTFMLPLNAWLLLCPSWLCCDWTMGTVPVLESFGDPRNLATLSFCAVFCLLVYSFFKNKHNESRNLLFLSMCVFPFIPASNLFFPVGFVVAERILYMPSIGFCFLVVAGFDSLLKKSTNEWRTALWLSAAALLFLFTMKTHVRNSDWKDEYSIFMAGLRVNRGNAKLFNNVGHVFEAEKRLDEALRFFTRASKIQPDDIGAHINVGRTFAALSRAEEAERAYRYALQLLPPVRPGKSYTARVAPHHLNVFINLGNLLVKNSSRLEEVDSLLRTAISMRSDFVQAYINRGDVLMRMNRTDEARSQYRQALKYQPDNADLYYNLGVVDIEMNRKVEAMQQFEQALIIDSNHKQALLNSAILLQEANSFETRSESKKRLLKVMELDPQDEKIYFNLGMVSMDLKEFDESRTWFTKAILLKPDFRSALFNLALLLSNDMNLHLDAVPVLEQLLRHHPRHTNGLILLGDISINHLKDLKRAEKCFRMIIAYDPTNVQAAHNLCVVDSERGDLLKAEHCLVDVHSKAPNEEYIKHHLNIIREKIASIRQQKRKTDD